MRPLMAHCHAGLGTLYTQTGRWEQAHTELSAAIELYRAMEMTFWLQRTEATLAQVLGMPPRSPGADSHSSAGKVHQLRSTAPRRRIGAEPDA